MNSINLPGEPPDLAMQDDLIALERRFRRALHRFDCPPAHDVGQYGLDLLAPEQRTQLASHLLACPRCAGELRTLRAYMKGDAAPTGNQGALQRLRRLVATLMPPPSFAQAGVRGTAGATSVLTYHAGHYIITLSPGVDRPGSRASLIGLIAPAGLAESAALLLQSGVDERLPYSAEIDQLGNFAIDDVVPGTYDVELRVGDDLIVLQRVGVGT